MVLICALLAGYLLMMDTTGFTTPQPPAKAQPDRDQFAADRVAQAAATPVTIDGQRALKYLNDLCAIGPRISASDGMKKQQDLLKAHFEKLGAKVEFQRFKGSQPSRPNPVDMANIIISWHPDRQRRIILCSHYDTRPRADQEDDERNWDKTFVSANDGTSGVALFMELAHHMKNLQTTVGVDFVLFDGEEYVFSGPNGRDRYFLGSEHFRDQYRGNRPAHTYTGAVLLDLFAGKDPTYPVEQNSNAKAPRLVQEIWRIGDELKVGAFRRIDGGAVLDDHLALNDAGIPAVDIIDFSYPHWHRLSDKPDQVSAESMVNIAKVLTVWFQRAR
jgi:hypothetical protein